MKCNGLSHDHGIRCPLPFLVEERCFETHLYSSREGVEKLSEDDHRFGFVFLSDPDVPLGASKGIITFGKDAEDVFLLKENHEFRPELRMHVGQGAEIGETPRFRLLSRENGNLRQSWPALRGQVWSPFS